VKLTTTVRTPAGSEPYATAVTLPFQIEIWPAACDDPGLVNTTDGSVGIEPAAPATHGEKPAHGFALDSVRSYDVR
jgi:hypothetical protein